MVFLILLILLILLLIGFLFLTAREAKTGHRLFGGWRTSLDTKMRGVEATLTHTPPSRVIVQVARTLVRNLLHEVAHVALVAIRVIERALTRLVHRVQKMESPPISTAENKEVE